MASVENHRAPRPRGTPAVCVGLKVAVGDGVVEWFESKGDGGNVILGGDCCLDREWGRVAVCACR